MVELTVPYKSRMKEAHTHKRAEYLNLTKELRDAGYKAVVIPVEVSARGFNGSSVYDLLTKLSICGNKSSEAIGSKTVPAGSGAKGMKGHSITIKKALTIRGAVG